MLLISLLRKFYPSLQEHKTVEAETSLLLKETLQEKYIEPQKNDHSLFRYAQHHFFSILFLSIYRALGIPRERRLLYGMINHAIRGIVTGTDNLLDDEYKEILPIRFPEKATRFKSIMHILLFDRFLFTVVNRAADKGLFTREDGKIIQKKIFQAMVPIGEEEATEENGVEIILPPEEILSSIHMYKGGSLLRLAFVVPSFMEKRLAVPLETVNRGIYRIGMALQIIDDLTDFYDDIENKKHNYLTSYIYFKGTGSEKEKMNSLFENYERNTPPIEQAYPYSVSKVMEYAVNEALTGFDMLSQSGFWLNRQDAMSLIRHLFYLRGVKNLFALLSRKDYAKAAARGIYGK